MNTLNFRSQAVSSLLKGASVLEVWNLDIQTLEEASYFLKSYGYDWERVEERELLEIYYRKALTYIQSELLNEGEVLDPRVSTPNKLDDLRKLLIYASVVGGGGEKQGDLQKWSCAILKVIHTYAHLDNDLFQFFSSEIQDQILKPITNNIHTAPASGTYLGDEKIPLKKFRSKNFKTSNSSVTKLLSKPDIFAFSLLDKMGLRFVTKSVFDSFRVLRYLLEKNMVSFPNNIYGQFSNTLYPYNLFLEAIEELTVEETLKSEEIDEVLEKKLASRSEKAVYVKRKNEFSGKGYKFIKFITRKLVRVPGQDLRFFYPFEVQILDYNTYLANISGTADHGQYKERQKKMVRRRILSWLEK